MKALAATLAVVAGGILAACTEEAVPQPEAISNPRLDAPPSDVSSTTSTTTGPAGADATPPSMDVSVQADLQVTAGTDVEVLLQFIEEHARSVNAGYSTPRLRAVTSAALLADQEDVIGWAGSQGYGVPDHPRVAVVAAERSARTSSFDVCLWLPSTEFVNRATGESVDPRVPAAWKPARATLTRHNVRWRVDRLANSDEKPATMCGGL